MTGDTGAAAETPVAYSDGAVQRWQAQTFLANHDAIIVTDRNGLILDWNPAAERIYGYARDEMLGKPTAAIHLPEDATTLTRAILDSMIREGIWSGEITFVRKDGTTGVCDTTVSPLLDGAGQVVGAFGVNRDITERKRLEAEREQALAEARAARLAAEAARAEAETVLDTIADAMMVYGPEGRIVRMNAAANLLFGFDLMAGFADLPLRERRERLRVTDAEGRELPVEALPQVRALDGETLTGAKAVDLRMATLYGSDVEVSASAAPLRDSSGAITGAVAVYRDVTARRGLERTLATRVAQLSATLDAMTEGVILYGPAGEIVLTNAAYRMQLGLSPDGHELHSSYEERGRDVRPRSASGELLPPEEWPTTRIQRGEVLHADHPAELLLTTYDGREARFAVTGAPVRDERGAYLGAVLVLRDVTERRRIELALQESEERFRATFAHARTGLALTDMQGTFVLVNAAYCAITGYSERELYATDLFTITHPDDRARNLEQIVRLVAGEIAGFVIEKRYVRRDGSSVWVQNSVFVIRDSRGQPRNIGAVTEDITERKRAEEALRESEEKFRTLADNIPTLAWMARPDGHIFWYNQRWYAYTGTTPDSQEGWGWESVHDTAVLPLVVERWTQSLATGEPFEMVFPLRGADGVFRPFLTRVVPVKDEQGQVVRWFGSNTDITEQRAVEEALRRANATKDEFLSIASHELRTPLTSITANIQLGERMLRPFTLAQDANAGDAGNTQPPAEMLARLHLLLARTNRQLGRLDRLVGDLLDVSRIQAGKLDMRPEACDLLAIVRDAVREQRAAWPKRKIEMDLPRIDAVPLYVDGERIGQVLTNYLTNALKYSPPDAPAVVRVRVRGDVARVEVRDSGPGLSAQQRAHLFERFYRVPGIKQQSGSGVGLGLGLFICKTIVERHGGQVGVRSTLDVGSTFWFNLPLRGARPDNSA